MKPANQQNFRRRINIFLSKSLSLLIFSLGALDQTPTSLFLPADLFGNLGFAVKKTLEVSSSVLLIVVKLGVCILAFPF